jgi:hypothetical protein
VGWDWVHLARGPLTGLLYQPQMIDDERGAVGGMRIGRGNQSTRRKPAPVPLCPPQIPHDLAWPRTPDRRGGKPATNRLSYGTVSASSKYNQVFPGWLMKAMKSFSKYRPHAVIHSNRLPFKYKADNRPFLLARLSVWKYDIKFNFETYYATGIKFASALK